MCRTVLRVVLQLATNQLICGATPPRPLQPGRTLCMCSPHLTMLEAAAASAYFKMNIFHLYPWGQPVNPSPGATMVIRQKFGGGRFDICQKLLLFLKASLSVLSDFIVKLREREGQRIDLGRLLKGHL